MQAVYSIGVKFAGGGIGNIAYHAAHGLHRHQYLHRLLCSTYAPSDIPSQRISTLGWPSRLLRKLAVYEKGYWLNHIHNLLYDRWAAHHITSCDIFHGWGGFSLRSIRKAQSLGAVTVVERASSHPRFHADILHQEYGRWGLSFKLPQQNVQRAETELQASDYVLIPSDFVRRTFLQHAFPAERLIQIPFGVDTTYFCPPEQRAKDRPFRVLFVGQIGVRKGVPYLLQAWQQLGWHNAELWLVGRVEAACTAVLAPYRDQAGVHFVGHISDPVPLFQQADVFAFPTIEEGSALVVYEALACGLPVITTSNAGSVIRDSEEGFIISIRNTEVLAERLEKLRANVKLREEMGRAARKRANQFTWTNYEEKLTRALVELTS